VGRASSEGTHLLPRVHPSQGPLLVPCWKLTQPVRGAKQQMSGKAAAQRERFRITEVWHNHGDIAVAYD
jgi:hypothetical protein